MEKKKSVFSKSDVRNILVSVRDNFQNCPADHKDFLETLIVQNTPGTRGRRSNIDHNALQELLNNVASKMTGAKTTTIANMAASRWNTRPTKKGETLSVIDAAQIKRLVATGKITLPDGLQFESRPRKPKTVAPTASPEPVEATAETA